MSNSDSKLPDVEGKQHSSVAYCRGVLNKGAQFAGSFDPSQRDTSAESVLPIPREKLTTKSLLKPLTENWTNRSIWASAVSLWLPEVDKLLLTLNFRLVYWKCWNNEPLVHIFSNSQYYCKLWYYLCTCLGRSHKHLPPNFVHPCFRSIERWPFEPANYFRYHVDWLNRLLKSNSVHDRANDWSCRSWGYVPSEFRRRCDNKVSLEINASDRLVIWPHKC